MTVLLTGASGFVGSHVFDVLRRAGHRPRLLLRASSARRFIDPHLSSATICEGSVDHPESLARAMEGVTHVVHCAGLVKALRVHEFYAINQVGTRNVVHAASVAKVSRLVHISSLAAAGPGTPDAPRHEADAPQPVSEYGKSKLAGEEEVRREGSVEHVIVRPPAVYGPRDAEFLRLFRAVRSGLLPDIGCGRQGLSLVFVEDLARIIVACLDHPAAAGQTYFAAHPEIRTARGFGEIIATELGKRPFRLPVPVPLLWPACAGQEMLSRLTHRPNVLSLQKYAELQAPGWVCDSTRLQTELGLTCQIGLVEGVSRTTAAYRRDGWL